MKILILGDTLLDISVHGSITRLSPEAPSSTVFDYQNETRHLGGAANVAANVASLLKNPQDHEIHYCGFFDNKINSMLREHGIIAYGQYVLPCEILTKTRYYVNDTQLFRVDNKKKYDVDFDLCDIDFNQYDLIVVSDYTKGTLQTRLCLGSDLFLKLLACNIPKIVDLKIKYDNIKAVGDNTIIKCNIQEFASIQFLNIDSHAENVSITVTEGSSGYCVYPEDIRYPAHSQNVVSLVGAGDTFAAGMAVNFIESKSFDVHAMAAFGNYCASKRVSKFNQIVKRKELDGI